MRIKTDILTSLMFARHQGGDRTYNDFFTFTDKILSEMPSKLHYQSAANKILFCTPETVLNFIKSEPDAFKAAVLLLLDVNEALKPGELYEANEKFFMIDLQQIKLRQILVKVIESEQPTDDLRMLCTKLLLRMGIASASGDLILRAALYQEKYQIDLTREIEFYCKRDELFEEPFVQGNTQYY